MLTLFYRNVHQALPEALAVLTNEGDVNDSRNGPVLEMCCPVATTYSHPQERVGFWSLRDANPFFHFFESLWMLAGRNDVEFPQKFNKNFGQYSDDGKTFHGAYGHRWRKHFAFDQLSHIIRMLKENDLTRRVVLQMWDGYADLDHDGKDLPCNTQCYFWIRHKDGDSTQPKVLHMTVTNRSNDIIFGCYGANAVHFSFLQEYIAQMVGVGIGSYVQFSNNWHCYTDFPIYKKLKPMIDTVQDFDFLHEDNPYVTGEVAPRPLVTHPETFDIDLGLFMRDPVFCDVTNTFFMKTAKPMWKAYECFKSDNVDRVDMALAHAQNIQADDWRKACIEWLQRRHNLLPKKA